ncbi:hypothetical protein GmHk_14G041209 [Glycine max]|nr:hypothetical protein GmHk_14G041209 [Glycine max]
MGHLNKCGLYVDDSPPRLVSLGRLYEGLKIVHNVPLGNNQVKDKQVAEGSMKPIDMSDPNVDPLYLMTLTIPQLFLKPLQVLWDASVFGVSHNLPFNRKVKEN